MFFLFNSLSEHLFPSLAAKERENVNLEEINPANPKNAHSILEFSALDIDGNLVNLSKYKGFVTYIVNVASQ